MALDAGTLIFVAYDRDELSSDPTEGVLGILTDAFDKEVQVEENGIGTGAFSLNVNSSQRAWCRPGNYVRAYRDSFSGQPLAGFVLDSGEDDLLSPDEEGGTILRRGGQGGIVTLKEAIVWHHAFLGSGAIVIREKGIWRFRDSHPARVLIRLLREAKQRGAIPHVDWDFTAEEDTDGNPWSDSAVEKWRIDIGQDLLAVVEDLRESGFHVEMGPNFVLHAWNDYDNDVSGSVAFEAGVNIRETAGRTVIARRAKSVVLVEGDFEDGDTRYLPVNDPDIEQALGRRKEGYFRYGRTATMAVLRRTGRHKLRRWRKRHDSIPALGLIDTTGMVAFEDYRTSDAVEVHIPPTYDRVVQRIVSITLVEGSDGTYDPAVELEELPADHETPAIGEVGESPGDATNNPSPNPQPHPIDPFNNPVAPPTMVAGGAIAAPVNTSEALSIALGTPPGVPSFGFGSAALEEVASWVGATQYPYPGSPFCSGMPGFGGWQEQERWYYFTVPAHPGSMAGIRITLTTGAGAAPADAGAEVVVRSSPPTAMRQGTVVGTVPHGGSADIVIPGGLVPSAGGVVYIGMRPKWQADYGATACGWGWPFTYGWLNSARLPVSAGSIVWMVWSVTGGSMGSIAEDPEAPWLGGNTWQEAGFEGSPVYAVDEQGYYVEASTPSGRGIMVQGPEEDETQNAGPWNDGWSYRFQFSVDAMGETGDPGTREIEVVSVGPSTRTVGTVHLGDMARDPGLSVGAPTDTDYEAVALTENEWWAARFDSRSGEMRGKVWLVEDGEPAGWNVSVPIAEGEQLGDRFELWLRAGNDGSAQRVTVRRLMGQAAAPDGTEVVLEFTGYAAGTSNEVPTDHRYREGSLAPAINGILAKPSVEYGSEARCSLDDYPTADSIITTTYTVDRGD